MFLDTTNVLKKNGCAVIHHEYSLGIYIADDHKTQTVVFAVVGTKTLFLVVRNDKVNVTLHISPPRISVDIVSEASHILLLARTLGVAVRNSSQRKYEVCPFFWTTVNNHRNPEDTRG